MDASVLPGAAILLDFIGQIESGNDYAVLWGHHERGLPKPITAMSIADVLTLQRTLGKKFPSTAAGRYQFMPSTLTGLIATPHLTGKELFSPDMQDRLGYQLLKQRGYADFMARKLTINAFGKHLGQEWASMPMLETTQGAHRRVSAGETYYAGDTLNRALVTPEKVEAVLARVHAASA